MLEKIGRASIALGLLMSAAFGVQIVAPAPASAGWLCDSGISCGDVYHSTSSNRSSLKYTLGWGTGPDGYVSRGNWASGRDIDGYYIPSGCWGDIYNGTSGDRYSVGSGWTKINDADNVYVSVEGC